MPSFSCAPPLPVFLVLFPFTFQGAVDDPVVYATLQQLASAPLAATYFPPPESEGGWRRLDQLDDMRRLAGMDTN
jgi:hypothetical protein